MSNYRAPAIHPRTKRIEQADYLDNHFGHYQYGVRFDDGTVWPIKAVHGQLAAEEIARIAALKDADDIGQQEKGAEK